MQAELQEIYTFLVQHPPFDSLAEDVLHKAVQNIEIRYYRSGSDILKYGDEIHHFHIIRSGAVELFRRKGELHNRLGEGETFGQFGLLMNNRVRIAARAIEDTLIYSLPETIFEEFCAASDEFSDFMEAEDRQRLRLAVTSATQGNTLTTSKVKTLLSREAVFLPSSATVQQAATMMAEENTSAILVLDPGQVRDGNGDGEFLGIVTDRDLCTRVLAQGIVPSTPLADIMSTEVVSLDHNAYISEAMMVMLRQQIHHLPILRNKRPVGLIEVSDIVRYESQSSLLIVNSIHSQQTLDELSLVAGEVKNCFVRMVNEDANSHMVGSAMSVIGRSFIQRLAELAEEELGSPPVPYCFLTLGSMARDEQLAVTDQDNALILDASYNEQEHGRYFERLASYICDGLAACGYAYCTGGIMASNPEWRKTQAEWERCFAEWIDTPQPKALLNSSIFFDLDGVCGRTKWANQLRSFIVKRARTSKRFLACLARNALNRTPPLGFFKNFVMEKDGRHNNSINLKRRGTAPLVDILRVHSLAAGSLANNSFERLDDIIETDILPQGKGPDLRDAMEFISIVRIRHQARDIESHTAPDNNIEPDNMSEFERRNLKDAFQILSNAQNFVKFRYHANTLK